MTACMQCNKVIVLPEKRLKTAIFCGLQCKADHAYNEYIRRWKSKKVNGSKSNGAVISSYVRRYLLQRCDYRCEHCGFNQHHPDGRTILQVDHKNGDSTNSYEENLWVLCPNCHELQPTSRGRNRGNGNPARKAFKATKYPSIAQR